MGLLGTTVKEADALHRSRVAPSALRELREEQKRIVREVVPMFADLLRPPRRTTLQHRVHRARRMDLG